MNQFALFHSSNPAICKEFNFVLEAVNLDSEVVSHDSRFYLLVDEEQASQAYQQLKLYVAENAPEEHLSRPLRSYAHGFAGAYLYALSLLLVGALKSANALHLNWQSNGLAHSVKIMQGEWWRTITALFLHADAAHLAGNIGFGALFGVLVSRYIGSSAAWFSILLAGAAGNALNAFLYQTTHLSIGASTMVFAALGMLGIFAINHHDAYTQRGLRRWTPFLATFALLGFIGTAGERTDIMAHLSGYICGCIGGVVWLLVLNRRGADVTSQGWFGIATIGLVCLAWVLALNT